MKTSLFEKLRQPTTVVLSAGHGAGDPGAMNGDFKEADEAIIMVDEIAKQLKKQGVTVDVVPHENGLKGAIKYVNDRYDSGDAWAICVWLTASLSIDSARERISPIKSRTIP